MASHLWLFGSRRCRHRLQRPIRAPTRLYNCNQPGRNPGQVRPDAPISTHLAATWHVPRAPRNSSGTSHIDLSILITARYPSRGGREGRTGTLIERQRVWKRQYQLGLCHDAFSQGALRAPKHPVAPLEWAPCWRDRYCSCELCAENEWTWGLRLIAALCLEDLRVGW